MSLFFRFFPNFTLLLAILGCSSPLSEPPISLKSLQGENRFPDIDEEAGAPMTLHFPLTELTTVEESLIARREMLHELTPANSSTNDQSNIGVDLHFSKAVSSPLSMETAVSLATANNLDVAIATLQPAISQQSIIVAQAAFDVVFGANATTTRNRIPQQTTVGFGFSSDEQATDVIQLDASLAKKLQGGGTLTLSTDVTKTNNNNDAFNFTPNPAWRSVAKLNLAQPLLRNFGKTVSRSEIRLSKLVKRKSLEDLRESIQTTITSTEHAYLDLSLQWKVLQVKEWLLGKGESVVNILELRRQYDTGEADYAQAVATVQQRRADVIAQQAAVHKASDLLKQIINSEQYSLESEIVIRPTNELDATGVSISLREAVLTAMSQRPDLRSLSYDINTSSIKMDVANNARLPQLDLQAQMSFFGLGESASDGYKEVFDSDFLNYVIGLSYEIPLGNRTFEAEFQSSRLNRMSSITSYQRGVQQAIVDVKSSLRDIVTNAELMRANRSYRIAQAENLRALQVEEEKMAGLNPTFLNLKLQTQNGLATARISELTSIVNYNKAITSLYQATGSTLDMHQISMDPFGQAGRE